MKHYPGGMTWAWGSGTRELFLVKVIQVTTIQTHRGKKVQSRSEQQLSQIGQGEGLVGGRRGEGKVTKGHRRV